MMIDFMGFHSRNRVYCSVFVAVCAITKAEGPNSRN